MNKIMMELLAQIARLEKENKQLKDRITELEMERIRNCPTT